MIGIQAYNRCILPVRVLFFIPYMEKVDTQHLNM